MRESSRLQLLERVLRLSPPLKRKKTEKVVANLRKTNEMFARLHKQTVGDRRTDIEAVIALLVSSREPEEFDAVCALVLQRHPQTISDTHRILKMIAYQVLETSNKEALCKLFETSKRILIQVLREEEKEEKEKALAFFFGAWPAAPSTLPIPKREMLSLLLGATAAEAFKTACTPPEEVSRFVNEVLQLDERIKVSTLANILLDKNRTVDFRAEKYRELYAHLESGEMENLLLDVGQDAQPPVFLEVSEYLLDCAGDKARAVNSTFLLLPLESLEKRVSLLATEHKAKALRQRAEAALDAPSGLHDPGRGLVRAILNACSTEEMLKCAILLLFSGASSRSSRMFITELVGCLAQEVREHLTAVLPVYFLVLAHPSKHSADLLRILCSPSDSQIGDKGTGKEKEKEREREREREKMELVEQHSLALARCILQSRTEAALLDNMFSSAFGSAVGSAPSPGESCRMLADYIKAECNAHGPVVQEVFAECMRPFCRNVPQDLLISLLDPELAKTNMLGMVANVLHQSVQGNLSREVAEHSRIPRTLQMAREHTTRMRSIMDALKKEISAHQSNNPTDFDLVFCIRYVCSVLCVVPLGAQDEIVREGANIPQVWHRILADLGRNEPVVIRALSGCTHLSQNQYRPLVQAVNAAVLPEQDTFLFLMLRFPCTNYAIQYLYILCAYSRNTHALLDASALENEWDTPEFLKGIVPEDQNGAHPETRDRVDMDGLSGVTVRSEPRTTALGPAPCTFAYDSKYLGSRIEISLPENTPGISEALRASRRSNRGEAECTNLDIIRILTARVLHLLQVPKYREAALFASLGRELKMKKVGLMSVRSLLRNSPETQPAISRYIQHSPDHREFLGLLSISPEPKKRKSKEARQIRYIRREKEEKEEPMHPIQRAEEVREKGILLAQLAASKDKPEEANLEKAAKEVDGLSASELESVSSQYYREVCRFWRSDREKISRNFPNFIAVTHLILEHAQSPLAVQHIVFAYVETTSAPMEEAFGIVRRIFRDILAGPKPVETIESVVGARQAYKESLVSVLGEHEQKYPGMLRACLSLPPRSTLFQAALLALSDMEASEVYAEALSISLGLIKDKSPHSRDDNVLYAALSFLKRRTGSGGSRTPEETGEDRIVPISSLLSVLKVRTKLDPPGILAVSMVEDMVLHAAAPLSAGEKEDLIAAFKYDLYYYRNLLLYFVEEVPIEEIVLIVARINTPEARSARPLLKKALSRWRPGKGEGMQLISALLDESKRGSAQDRVFVLSILSKSLPEFVQGAWLTAFYQVSEALANEEAEEVLEAQKKIVATILAQGQIRSRMRKIYNHWASQPNLSSLVQKLSKVFE